MIGKTVTDVIHNADHAELIKQFGKTSTDGKLAITEHEGKLMATINSKMDGKAKGGNTAVFFFLPSLSVGVNS